MALGHRAAAPRLAEGSPPHTGPRELAAPPPHSGNAGQCPLGRTQHLPGSGPTGQSEPGRARGHCEGKSLAGLQGQSKGLQGGSLMPRPGLGRRVLGRRQLQAQQPSAVQSNPVQFRAERGVSTAPTAAPSPSRKEIAKAEANPWEGSGAAGEAAAPGAGACGPGPSGWAASVSW